MATKLTAYRVFIASPGGLDEERRVFRETIQKHCENDGYARKIIFIPVGWEETLGGKRRPQSAINDELATCDYFVLVLWDRWGTPPDRTGHYTSGTEEEFEFAKKLIANAKKPMRDIVIFFKAVELKQLSDPGDQLKKVQDFKKKLEETKEHFFHSFDTSRKFEDLLSRFLHQWVRDDEGGRTAKKKPRRPKGGGDVLAPAETPTSPIQPSPASDVAKLLDKAESLANKGKLTEAEAIFSRAVIKGNDPAALNQYGNFLLRLGRMDQAKKSFEQALAVSRSTGNKRSATDALGNLGNLYFFLGYARKAIEFFEQQLAVAREAGDRQGEGDAIGGLGNACAVLGETPKAIEFYQQYLVIAREVGNRRGEGIALSGLGLANSTLGNNHKAIELFEQYLAIAREIGSRLDESIALGNLGNAYVHLGEKRKAIEFYQQQLATAREAGYRRGEGSALANLGVAYEKLDEARKAIEFYQKARVIMRELGDRRGEGISLWNSAVALNKLGQKAEAVAQGEAALAIYEAIEHPSAAKARMILTSWRGRAAD